MSLSRTRHLILTLSLLWPAAAFAQTPTIPPQAGPPLIQIEVDFASVSTADLDKSGIAFDRVPYNAPSTSPGQTGSFLRYVTGAFAAQFLQTLRHTPGKVTQAPLITTSNELPATIQVFTQVPDRAAGFLPVQNGLTVTPRINTDDSITLSVAPQTVGVAGDSPASELPQTMLRTIRSGDVMAVDGLPFKPGKSVSGQQLLIFITPVILVTDAPKADVGRLGLPFPIKDLSPDSGATVRLEVFNADIHAVVALLERQLGLKASVQGGNGAYKPVSVHLNGASRDELLGAIARSAGAQIIRDENGVYVFSPLPGAARTQAPAATPSP